jgi:hypothetical protein
MTHRSRRFLMLAGVQVVAIVIGASAGVVGLDARGAEPVHAGNHCTKYAPVVVVRDTYNHEDCQFSAGLVAWTGYATPSFGWRDTNKILLTSGQFWELYLYDTGGNPYNYFAGNGTGWNTGGVGSVQTKATCSTHAGAVSGHCYTNWHD